jgi:predicted metal-binding membrane protein
MSAPAALRLRHRTGNPIWLAMRAQTPFLLLLAGLITLAWLSLWIWKESPYGRFLDHQENESVHNLSDHYLALVVLFVAGWTLMTVAMMLPTSVPLITFFRAVVRARPERGRLLGLLIFGYLAVWTLFAIFVHVNDLGVHRIVDRIAWLEANPWVIAAATFLLAGSYQFTSLKSRCLEKCRSPMSFVMEHWRGGRGYANAFRLGVHHGIFCLGCCWSLMLLMFAVGVGNIGWMLGLGAVMTIEKNMPWGRRLSAPLGVALIGWGSALVLVELPLGN